MQMAGEAATMVILERSGDPTAQFDQSRIRQALVDFPEVKGEETALNSKAREMMSTYRTDVENMADALVEKGALNGDEALRVIVEGPNTHR